MSLQRFIQNISRIGGLAKTNRFKVDILIPSVLSRNGINTEELSLVCETAELPGKTLQTAEAKVYGPTYKIPYQKQFQDINLTFLCSVKGIERTFFDDWIEYIMPTETNNIRFRDGYQTKIKIFHLKEYGRDKNSLGGDIIRTVILEEAFPIGYASQQLNWGDDGFQKLTVQFAYRRFIEFLN
jgi:hypothetical protein